jgi:hypothetical protein
VYSRPIKIYQGIDNPIQVIVRNQDQKAVDLTGYAVQADIQDPTNRVTIASYAVTWANQAKGLGNFTIDINTVNSLEQRFYKLTFRRIEDAGGGDVIETPIYIDDNYGVPLDLEILPAYYSDTEPLPGIDYSVFDGGTI